MHFPKTLTAKDNIALTLTVKFIIILTLTVKFMLSPYLREWEGYG